jgi:ribosomal subunit interface protein
MLRVEINQVHGKMDDRLGRYITKKIGGLEKYLNRASRTSAHAEVKLKSEEGIKDKNHHTCEVILHVPQETITVSETTVNMYAAVDIAEEKLKHSLRKYKEKHDVPRLHRRLAAKFRRQRESDAGEAVLDSELI